jgi:transcriptional regulator with XRE-family HTH domain
MGAQTIRALREAQGQSQEELAQILKVPQATLTEWELGTAQPSTEHFRALCDEFGVAEHEIQLDPHSSPDITDRMQDLF